MKHDFLQQWEVFSVCVCVRVRQKDKICTRETQTTKGWWRKVHNDELHIKSGLFSKYDLLTPRYADWITDCVVQINECWRHITVICIRPRVTRLSRENMRKLHLPLYSKSTVTVIGINWKLAMYICFDMNCLQTVSIFCKKFPPLDCQRYLIYFVRTNRARVFHPFKRAENSNILNSFHEMENFIPCAKDSKMLYI